MRVKAHIMFSAKHLFHGKPFDKKRIGVALQLFQHGNPATHHQLTAPFQSARYGFNAATISGGKFGGFIIKFFEQQIRQRRHWLLQIAEMVDEIINGSRESSHQWQAIRLKRICGSGF